MRQGVQTLLAELGEAACLALCICELGKPGISEGEALENILEAIRRGWIDYDEQNRNNPDNCFVKQRDELMELVTGQKGWTSTTEAPGYQPKPGERCIECWMWVEHTRGSTTKHQHFRLNDWDPYHDPLTVKNGYLQSLRVFRRKS
jgi:hypothetical protein